MTRLIETLGFTTTNQAGGADRPARHAGHRGQRLGQPDGDPVGTVAHGDVGSLAQRPIRVEGNPAVYEFTYGGLPGTTLPSPPNASGVTYALDPLDTPDWSYTVRPQRGHLVERGSASSRSP